MKRRISGTDALLPLLLLETDEEILEDLHAGENRTWQHVRDDRNSFFCFVHADEEAGAAGVVALREFPDDKVEWPVDLTRQGFDFPRTFLNSRKCAPRTTEGVPLHLRPKSSSFWANDPFRLVGNLTSHGNVETAGIDYLVAYWLGRYRGFVKEDD